MNRTTAPIVTATFDRTQRRYTGILLGSGYAPGTARIETLAELDLVLERSAPDLLLAFFEADGSFSIGLDPGFFLARARAVISGAG